MRNSIYLCCTWLVLLIGTAIVVEADTVTVQELLQEYGREELCKQIETNSMAGFSCGAARADLHRCYDSISKDLSAAKLFLQHHPEFTTDDIQPVILFPGLGASALEAKLDHAKVPYWYCAKTWDWYQIWLALYELAVQPCWLNDLQIFYNATSNTYSNQSGVFIIPQDFGGLKGVTYLDSVDDLFHLTAVYASFVDNFVSLGWQPGVNLFGAPYDWRLPTDQLYESFWDEDLVQLVETAYAKSGGKKVHLITHSMGGPTVLYFLNRMSSDWKEQYIATFIPLAGPWSGSPKALKAQISGDDFGIGIGSLHILNPKRVAAVARQSGGIGELVPDPTFWPDNQIFIRTPKKNYTAADFVDLFYDVGTPITATIHTRTMNIIADLEHPNVTTYCLYGYNVSTPIAYTYADFTGNSNDVGDPIATDTSDLGDGTVPLLSLIECKNWAGANSVNINCKEYDLVQHTAVLKDTELIHDVIEIVTGLSSISGCDTPVLDAALARGAL